MSLLEGWLWTYHGRVGEFKGMVVGCVGCQYVRNGGSGVKKLKGLLGCNTVVGEFISELPSITQNCSPRIPT